jgi:hypothetical protein
MASSPATLVAIATALFVAVAVARPPTLSPSPSPSRAHPPCCLPPSLPPQSSPCHRHYCCLPCTLVLLIACHPHCRHSRCRHHRPRCRLPHTLVAIAIALATVASAIVIACHPCCRCNCPLCRLCLHSPATLVASRRHPACRPTAVATVVAAAGCQPWPWWRSWQCSNKVNEDNNNNMTTTQQPTQQPTRQPTQGGDN